MASGTSGTSGTLVLVLTMLSGAHCSLPVVCWHGVNDNAASCNGPISHIQESIPDLYSVSVMIGDNLDMDTANSVLMKADDQISYVCNLIQNDARLAGGYNAIGISQGGLMFRGLAQRCPYPPIRNLITFGSPHQGVYGVPECQASTGSAILCELIRRLLTEGAYIPWIQDLITPAQYWHDPFNRTGFLAGSHYLADINNEREGKNDDYRNSLLSLDNLVLVKWTEETTIIPAVSSHFGFYIQGQDLLTLKLEQLPMYNEDWLGLKVLDEDNRLHFLEMEGDHMQFQWVWFTENIVIPFLV